MTGWSDYAAGTAGDHFAWFCERYFVQSIDRWDGEPLILEPWQREFFDEVLSIDDDEMPYWRTCVLIMPRKNSKTTMLSAMGLYRLLLSNGRPTILMAASSDGQAKHLFDAASSFALRNEDIASEIMVRDYLGEITRNDRRGLMRRVASDYRRLHGQNPSMVLADEIAFWTTPTLRKAWAALTTASGARKDAQVMAISTAGEVIWRHDSIVGSMLDEGLALGDVEGTLPGKRVIRDHRSRTIIFEYASTMPQADPEPLRQSAARVKRLERDGAPQSDVKNAEKEYEAAADALYDAWKPANPASWIDREYLLAEALAPSLSKEDVLQLHACVWTESEAQWVTPDEWKGYQSDDRLEPGDLITLGFDGSETDDATALIAARVSDGLIQPIGVWAKPEGAKYWHVPRDEVAAAVDEAFEEYIVALMLCDRPFWQSEIDKWASVWPKQVMEFRTANVNKMSASIERFATDLSSGMVRHTGDQVVTNHMLNAQRVRSGTMGWKLSKPSSDSDRKIDAAVASVLAWEARAYAIEKNLNPRPKPKTLVTF